MLIGPMSEPSQNSAETLVGCKSMEFWMGRSWPQAVTIIVDASDVLKAIKLGRSSLWIVST